MTIPTWHEEPIAKHHNRNAFDCGEAALNEFLSRYARQAHESGSTKTFVAVAEDGTAKILGFYSISPASVDYARTPDVIKRRLARHDVPVFRLARLAVDRTVQGKGLGGRLLLTAGRRCLRVSQEIGGVALLIDAKNERVAKWYESYGALRLLDAPLTLTLPLESIRMALESDGNL